MAVIGSLFTKSTRTLPLLALLLGSIAQPAHSTLVSGRLQYASTIDPHLDDLHASYVYEQPLHGLDPASIPLLVLMHGFNQDAADIPEETMRDLARDGYFTVAIGMRGRDGAGGTPDVNGRELHDIIDGVDALLRKHPGVIAEDRKALIGISGGGGNALALATRAPDYFEALASISGISDYGHHPQASWASQMPRRQPRLVEWISAKSRDDWFPIAPVDPHPYAARDVTTAMPKNYTGGHVLIAHDEDDHVVPVGQSRRVRDAMQEAQRTNFTYVESTSGSEHRWEHSEEQTPVNIERAVDLIAPHLETGEWSVPPRGEALVQGFLITDRFEIWLGDGTHDVGSLKYDTDTGRYEVEPITPPPLRVRVRQGNAVAVRELSEPGTLTVETSQAASESNGDDEALQPAMP